jgi:acyl-CoA reductase-like NAD-dependent aldehyde dehydrogenase
VPDVSGAGVDAAVAAAHRAYADWRRDDDRRRALLRSAADTVETAAPELAALLTAEQGKPLPESRRELAGTVSCLRYYADADLMPETAPSSLSGRATLVRRPIGVVAAISPSNFPMLLSMSKVAPALRVGNTVVLKPSPYTPLAVLQVGEFLSGILPAGVFRVVTGGEVTGAQLTTHPLVREVSFTGSIAVGRTIAENVSGDLRRLVLELGGNDPLIVLDDADPGQIAEEIFWLAFNNNGQVGVAPKRVYVAEELRAALVDALAALADGAKVGDGMNPGVQLGPLNNAPQRDRVAALVEEARAHGAAVVAGGRPLGRYGYFYAPTIVTGVDPRERLVTEEQFGPALPVLGYRDLDDAVRWANEGTYGLGSSVWGADETRAATVADQLNTGLSWINTHTALPAIFPFAGAELSGVGVEGSVSRLDSYSDFQTRYVAA